MLPLFIFLRSIAFPCIRYFILFDLFLNNVFPHSAHSIKAAFEYSEIPLFLRNLPQKKLTQKKKLQRLPTARNQSFPPQAARKTLIFPLHGINSRRKEELGGRRRRKVRPEREEDEEWRSSVTRQWAAASESRSLTSTSMGLSAPGGV